MTNRPIIVATGNEGKLREIKAMLQGLPLVITSLKDHWSPLPQIPENGETFLENAYAKAAWVSARMPQYWALADDSGLEVDFLSGDPGVRSARYAGPDATDKENNRKLLTLLAACPPDQRTARFRCVMFLRAGENDDFAAEGVCEGSIGLEPRGAGGFGYDPLFIPHGESRTFAELDPAKKNHISHRGKALIHLRSKIIELLEKK